MPQYFLIFIFFLTPLIVEKSQANTSFLINEDFISRDKDSVLNMIKETQSIAIELEKRYPLENKRYTSLFYWISEELSPKAWAASYRDGDICYHGLWPSIFQGGKCSSPWRVSDVAQLKALGPTYPKNSPCRRNEFVCPPILAYSPNGLLCVPMDINTRSQACVNASQKNIKEMVNKIDTDPQFRENFTKQTNEFVELCDDPNSRITACDEFTKYVFQFKDAPENIQKIVQTNKLKTKKELPSTDFDLPKQSNINNCHKHSHNRPIPLKHVSKVVYQDGRSANGDCLPPLSEPAEKILKRNKINALRFFADGTRYNAGKDEINSLARLIAGIETISNRNFNLHKGETFKFWNTHGASNQSINGINIRISNQRKSGLNASSSLHCHGKLGVHSGRHNHGGLAHELGHKIGNSKYPGKGASVYTTYIEKMKGTCTVSGYNKNKNETFAEVFTAYITNPDILLTRGAKCKKAYEFMKNLFGENTMRTCAQRYAMNKGEQKTILADTAQEHNQ